MFVSCIPCSILPEVPEHQRILEAGFLKPAEGERYYNPSDRGRGRGRGRGEHGGFRGGYRGPAAAPAIEDQAQFPALA